MDKLMEVKTKDEIIEWLKKLWKYQEQDIINYANYCYKLANAKDKDKKFKNEWIKNKKVEHFIDIFNKVANEWLVFDWVHITLQSTWVSYDYVAYKNKMLNTYPESIIDVSLVYKWDEYWFDKKDGVVNYFHKIANPFWNKNENVVWAYVIIKNKRWEFLTTLSKEEMDKHKKVAKTQKIWNDWYAEMCMKTIMKKWCKLHYWDVFTWIEAMDNENYDLEKLKVTEEEATDGFTPANKDK